jgi:hypothetical protein
MNRAIKAGALGAEIGFFVMVCILVFHVRTPLILGVLWPTRVLMHAATGGFWMLTFQVVAFFSNALLYGVIGYVLGRYIEGRRGDASGRQRD